MHVAVIAACHDRREMTVRALTTAQRSLESAGATASFTVFDDASSDGTPDALRNLGFPVRVVDGNGAAFWARGMAAAERAALANEQDADLLVWLNDDVAVDEDAFERLLAQVHDAPGAIVVASVREEDGRVSYSGYRRRGPHPLRFSQVLPTARREPLDTFNGNLVCVPMAVRRRVGAIDGGFAHQLADIDYGYRARARRVPVLLAPGTFGVCPTNPEPPSRPTSEQWRRFLSVKGGGHPGSMRRFLQRHARATWPVWMGTTYGLWWVRAARAHLSGSTSGSARGA